MSAQSQEYFLPGQGIDRDVITAEIAKYLGNDAIVRPGICENPTTQESQHGYFITGYRNLTIAMIEDLRREGSDKWIEERRLQQPNRSREMITTIIISYLSAGFNVPASAIRIRSAVDTTLPETIKHLKPSRQCLPICLNGHYFESYADFGSEGNIIRKDLVEKLKLEVMRNVGDCPVFRLPTGGRLLPYGRVLLHCQFPEEDESVGYFEFFVFNSFVIPLILGKRFLRTTKTLELHFHRLKNRSNSVGDLPLVAYLGDDYEHKQEQISFWLNGTKLDSTPDTGSEINLLSLDFALRWGLNFNSHKFMNMQFADGTVVSSRGSITLDVSFGGDGAPPVTRLELVDLSGEGYQTPATGGKIAYGPQTAIAAEFHILEGLQVDVLLGVDVLATVDAFVQHNRHFKFTPARLGLYDLFMTEQLSPIAAAWAQKRCPGSGIQVIDKVQDLLHQRHGLYMFEDRRQDEAKIRAFGLNEQDRITEAQRDQKALESFRRRIEEITAQIMREYNKAQQQPGNFDFTNHDSEANRTRNPGPLVPPPATYGYLNPQVNSVPTPGTLVTPPASRGYQSPAPFISSAPSSYRVGSSSSSSYATYPPEYTFGYTSAPIQAPTQAPTRTPQPQQLEAQRRARDNCRTQ